MGKSYLISVLIIFTLTVILPPSVCYGGDREKYPDPENTTPYLSWLKDGETSKEQVFEKLGWPDDCFLENKIIIFHLYGPSEKNVSKYISNGRSSWIIHPNVYSLQLVFESSKNDNKNHENNILMRHSLVKIRNEVSVFGDIRSDYPGRGKKSCMD